MASTRPAFPALAAFSTAALAACLLACSGGGGGGYGSGSPIVTPPPPPVVRVAALSGGDEAPSNPSSARGVAIFAVDPTSKALTGTVLTTGVPGTASHIHLGDKGVAGAVSVPLASGAGGVWTVPAGTVLTDAQYAAFQAHGLYVNVHSAAYAGGEIRGQIAFKVKYASLSASQETPATTSTATGIGALMVDPLSGEIRGGIKVTGLTGTAAHIHEAAAGVAGSVIVPLQDAGNGLWMVAAGRTLTAAQVASFDANGLYFNIHTPANPGGEIRGQISMASPVMRTFSLAGSQEVPPNASTATATGTVSLDPATLEMRGTLLSTGLTGTAAHIHEGAAGVAGGVDVPFTAGTGGAWSIGAGWYLTGAQFASYQAGNLYANIHSAAYPGGEIRGQIPADSGTSGGGGGGGTGGTGGY